MDQEALHQEEQQTLLAVLAVLVIPEEMADKDLAEL